jgi:GT2 family glycosyltransferase
MRTKTGEDSMAPDPSRLVSFRRQLWKLETGLQKRRILWEDRLGLYPYGLWVRAVEQPRLRARLKKLSPEPGPGPLVGFVSAAERCEQDGLLETIGSLRQFRSLRWVFSILAPQGSTFLRESWFQALLPAEPRLKVVTCADKTGPADWVRQAAGLEGDWLVPLSAGDRLSFAWAGLFLFTVSQNPDADLVYWDEDRLGRDGARSRPFFKPDWSPALLVALNYLETAAFRKDLLLRGAARIESRPEGWIFPLAGCSARVEHIAWVLQHRPAPPAEALRRSVEKHARQAADGLRAWGCRDAQAVVNPEGRIRVSWQADFPKVSLIIPTRDNLAYLERCLSSLLAKTDYPDYELIIVDDHSSDPAVLAYYRRLLADEPRARVVPNETEFNYSRVNNAGARLARGSLLLFLNNDTEILHSGWLAEMARWCLLPGVGAVGAKLLYPDRSIQHAGIVVGMTGHAAHLYAGGGRPGGQGFVSPDDYRDVAAATGACLLVRRDVFEGVGGFDEELRLVFNDVELCQRVRRAGYRIVYTPAAVLIHHEGRSRSRYNPPGDIRLGADLLGPEVDRGDPYYNANLSLAVNWPALRRPDEPQAIERLREIVRYQA